MIYAIENVVTRFGEFWVSELRFGEGNDALMGRDSKNCSLIKMARL